jgi:HK97 family phage major capsid protein
MEPNREYARWVAELTEKQTRARDLVEKIEDGRSSAADRAELRKITPEVAGLAKKIEAFRTAQSVDEFRTMEATAARAERNPALATPSRRGLTRIGAVHTEEEVVDVSSLRRYSSFEREFGERKFEAIGGYDGQKLREYRAATEKALRFGRSGLSEMERRAIDSGADERGAILAPVDIINEIVGRLTTPTRVAGAVREINTSRDSVQFYRNTYDTDDLYSNKFRRVKTGSKPISSTEANVMAATDSYFAPIKIQVHTMMMVGQIENDLLEDASFDLLGWFQDEVSKSAAVDRDNDILNGDGVGCPVGLLRYIDSTSFGNFKINSVISGSNTALTDAGLSNLLWDLPEQYIEPARILMGRTKAGKALAALRSAGGDRIFGNPGSPNGASLVGPSGATLEGYPILWSEWMPTVAQNNFPILFGDFSGYVSLTRSNISIQILDQTRAKENMTEVVAKLRYGGDLIEPYKFRAQKVSSS